MRILIKINEILDFSMIFTKFLIFFLIYLINGDAKCHENRGTTVFLCELSEFEVEILKKVLLEVFDFGRRQRIQFSGI